jgi:hypothetical protein
MAVHLLSAPLGLEDGQHPRTEEVVDKMRSARFESDGAGHLLTLGPQAPGASAACREQRGRQVDGELVVE